MMDYKLEKREGMADALKYINSRGIKINWLTIPRNNLAVGVSSSFINVTMEVKLPKEFTIKINGTVKEMISEVTSILIKIESYDKHNSDLIDNEDIVYFRDLFNNLDKS